MNALRPRPRLALLGAAALAVVLSTSGCDAVSGTGISPGNAADVDGATVSMSSVDDAAAALCASTVDTGTGQGAVTGYVARATALEGLVAHEVADKMNEQYGVVPSPWYQGYAASQRANYPSLSDDQYADLEPALTGFAYFIDLVGEFALPAGSAPSTTIDEARTRFQDGLPLAVAWNKEHPISTDASLPQITIDAQAVFALSSSDRGLSVPISTVATQALAQNDPSNQDLATYADTLPSSQRCG